MLTGQQTINECAPVAALQLYTLENRHGTRMLVSAYGAAVQSLFVKDRYGKVEDIVLGYDELDAYINDQFYIGTVIGRYANRISGSSILLNGNEYPIAAKNGYHLHGGNIGFNKKHFHVKLFHAPGKQGIVLSYTSADLEEGFPGVLTLEVTYTLDDDNAWTVEYAAATTKTTLVNFTQHSYFNLSGNLNSTVEKQELRINAPWFLPVNPLQVPTGEIRQVSNSVFDFTSFKTIGKDIEASDGQLQLSHGFDHSFVLEKNHSMQLKHAATAKDPASGRVMEVFTTEPAVHFYSGNFLDAVKGKAGQVYQRRSGFCLETQHFPDAPNHPHFPSTVLQAGETFYSKTVFRFSVE